MDPSVLNTDDPDLEDSVLRILELHFPNQESEQIVAHQKLIECFSKLRPGSSPSSPGSKSDNVHNENASSVKHEPISPSLNQQTLQSFSFIESMPPKDHFSWIKAPTPKAVLLHSQVVPEEKKGKRWTEEQDQMLRKAVKIYGPRNWKMVAKMVDDRDHVQCLQRWNKVLRPGLVKGPWTSGEDISLKKLIEYQGNDKDPKWATIASQIPGRTAKQCRERWKLNLDPSIDHSPFSPEEDRLLLKLHDQHGNKWALIRQHFKARTENAVKTRFKSLLRSQAKNFTESEDSFLLQMCHRYRNNWEQVQQAMPNKSIDILQERYKELGEAKQSEWTASNDKSLLENVSKYAGKWDLIAKHFPSWNQDFLERRYLMACKRMPEYLSGFVNDPYNDPYQYKLPTSNSKENACKKQDEGKEESWGFPEEHGSYPTAPLPVPAPVLEKKRRRINSNKRTGQSSQLITKAAVKELQGQRLQNHETATTVASSEIDRGGAYYNLDYSILDSFEPYPYSNDLVLNHDFSLPNDSVSHSFSASNSPQYLT